MSDFTIRTGRIRLKAGKNQAGGKSMRRVDMPILPPLQARLDAALSRREAKGHTHTYLISHPDADRDYPVSSHGKHFREARAFAANIHPTLIGEGLDDWGEPIPAFTFEDCRDAGITRLFASGCTVEEAVSWSNHKDADTLRALHAAYYELGADVADAAGAKLMAHARKKGIKV